MAVVIPERDVTRPLSTFPIALVLIIVANFVVFVAELALGDPFVERYSMVPAQIVAGQHWETLITSMFLHASWLHIGGNMLYLWVFGDELEANYLGSLRFPIFYLLCGLAADFLQIAVDPTSTVPNLGASGAIAGVLGGFMVVFPHDEILSLVLGLIGIFQTRVTAAVFIGIWFLMQLINGLGSITSVESGGVAYFAHIGGFIAGVLLIKPLVIGHPPGPEESLVEPI
jgi:membrane associated rhomboid family serine protease